VAVLAIGGALGIVVGMGIGASQSDPPPPAAVRRAEVQYRETLALCISSLGQGDLHGLSREEVCRQSVRLGDFLPGGSLTLARFPSVLEGTASLLGMMTAVLGASLVGADWSSGTMGTLLTWEAGRGRILAARAAVIATVVLGLAIGMQVLFASAWWLATVARGTTLASEGWLGEVAETIARVSLMGAVLALITAGLATIARSTAGGMIGLLMAVVLVDWFARIFQPEWAAFGLIQNAIVLVSGVPAYIVDNAGNQVAMVTAGAAAAALVVWAGVLLAVGATTFVRRDVT
jgi:ABC-type transport system involved in multi-copper enzyme maturation permease subunit